MRPFLCFMLIVIVSTINHASEVPEILTIYDFSENTLQANSWVELPGGFESAPPGDIQLAPFQAGTLQSSTDGYGITVSVQPGQVAFLYAAEPIETNGAPILLRLIAQASSPWASLALVAIQGDLTTGDNVDGSLALSFPASSAAFVDQERRLVVTYEPDQGHIFTPALQVAGVGQSADQTATVWIDKVEVLRLDPTHFGATMTDETPLPTPTPLPGGVHEFEGLLSDSSGLSVLEDTFADVWQFTLNSRQEIVIDLISESFDAFLILYRGTIPSEDAYIVEDDDGGEGFNSRLRINLDAGTYSIEATTFDPGETGAYILRSTIALTPTFETPPTPTPTPRPDPQPGEAITIPIALPDGATPLEMVLIPAGAFLMGSPEDEVGRAPDEGPVRRVTISRDFYMGKYEITQEQYQAVMGDNPSRFIFGSPNRPVEQVTWFDAARFSNRLSELMGRQPVYDEETWEANMDAGGFRLPTEAEWEYACRAGSQTRYYWGDDPNHDLVDSYAWYVVNSGGPNDGPNPVGLKLPNAFGLYDMSGNVAEWCQDWYSGTYPDNDEIDPIGPLFDIDPQSDRALRVTRGATLNNTALAMRSASRVWWTAPLHTSSLGIRIVLPVQGFFEPLPPIPTNTPLAPQLTATPTPTPTPAPPLSTPTATFTPVTATPTPDPGGQPGETITIPLDLPDGATPLEIIRIPAGEFIMGSPEDEIELLVYQFGEESPREIYRDEGPQRRVTLSRSLFIGKRQVTWAQYYAVMGDLPTGLLDVNSNLPVWNVSWFNAARFCNRLSNLLGLTPVYDEIDWTASPNSDGIRLPTEAEWEYACRAGTTTRYYWGDDPHLGPPASNIDLELVEIGDYAWVGGFSGGRIHEVGLKRPNAFGLYDMSGNVFEWCQDWFAPYHDFDEEDPAGPQRDLQSKVARGGHALWHPYQARSAYRGRFSPTYDQDGDIGFRIARTP